MRDGLSPAQKHLLNFRNGKTSLPPPPPSLPQRQALWLLPAGGHGDSRSCASPPRHPRTNSPPGRSSSDCPRRPSSAAAPFAAPPPPRDFRLAHHGHQPSLPLIYGEHGDSLYITPFHHRAGLVAADRFQSDGRLDGFHN
ncbi:hypothetical protein ZWY2020_010246 [Hordeum vulgare]|nr:hypothetical protein ZWY2020_010246 [Hordeum vulgare]